jgi:hypothetical protein
MKRLLLLFITSLTINTVSSAQSLQIESIQSNFFDPLQNALAIKGNIRNLSNDNVNILMKSYPQSMPEGSVTFFCWAQCYNPNVTVSPTALSAEPNGLITQFHGYYRDNGASGEAIINFVFFREDNPNDSLLLTAIFDPATVSIRNIDSPDYTTSAFPNPANDKLNIVYKNINPNSGAKLELYNMLGVLVSQYTIPQSEGTIVIPTHTMKAGVYFYIIREAGVSSKAQRVTIKH